MVSPSQLRLTRLLTSAQLTGVPAALQSTQDDDGNGNGYTYAEVDTYDWVQRPCTMTVQVRS